ncbi:MAG: hypothetical protein ABIO17_06915 [Pseudoxanthomonas sp.]
MVLKTWHRKDDRLQANASVDSTAWFLWVLVVVALVVVLLTCALGWLNAKENRHDCTRAGQPVECPQRREAHAGWETKANDVGHAGRVNLARRQEYVRGVQS